MTVRVNMGDCGTIPGREWSSAMTSNEQLVSEIQQVYLTQHHEAGHAVVDYLYGVLPLRIRGAHFQQDRRSTAFLKRRSGLLTTPFAREKAQRCAVSCIAGIAAESKFGGVPLADMRDTYGAGDYAIATSIANRLMLHDGYIAECPEVCSAYLRLWESKAVALMNVPQIWAAVESLANELCVWCGELDAKEIIAAIKEGLNDEASQYRRV
jgi:hypothetical protein